MRNASAALIALLNSSKQLAVADCLTITLTDGTITRWTNASEAVTVVSQYDGLSHTFSPSMTFTRGATKLVIGTEVDNLEVTLYPEATRNTLNGLPWPAAARRGALDGAGVLLEKVIMSSFYDTTPGTIILFWGVVGSPKLSRSTIVLEVQSDLVLLQAQLPRNLYQPGCLHTLFDSGCGLSAGSFTDTGTVQSGSSTTSIKTNNGHATGYFNLGYLTFTSGAMNGLRVPVRTFTLPSVNDGIFVPVYQLPAVPQAGDTFAAVPGCDKTTSVCNTKFSNLSRFRGFPVVPAPETAR